MQLNGEQRIAAPPERVWAALNDPAVLAASIPGCQSLEQDGEGFKAVVEIKIGPIGARFNGAVVLKDLDPPRSYRIEGQGQGGIAGSAKGGANVNLVADGAGTLLTYAVDAEVGGRLAQLGGPIIEATARQLAAKFFKRFEEDVTGAAKPDVASAPPLLDPGVPALASGVLPVNLLLTTLAALLAGVVLGRSAFENIWIIAVLVLAAACILAGWQAGRGGRR